MKKELLKILIFITIYSHGQQSGEIIYGKELIFKTNITHTMINVNRIANDASDLAKKLDYKMVFTEEESLFNIIENLELEGVSFGLSNAGSKGEFYKSKFETLQQREFAGDIYLIRLNTDELKWQLTNETKKIDKYTCYKAILATKTPAKNNGFIETITAWYAPAININYGPIGYGDLPGIILELELVKYKTKKNIMKTKFYAKKIKFYKEVEITKPKKGIDVTKDEFNQIIKDAFRNK